MIEDATRRGLSEEFEGLIISDIVESLKVRVANDRVVLTGTGLDEGQLEYAKGRLRRNLKEIVDRAHEDATAELESRSGN